MASLLAWKPLPALELEAKGYLAKETVDTFPGHRGRRINERLALAGRCTLPKRKASEKDPAGERKEMKERGTLKERKA